MRKSEKITKNLKTGGGTLPRDGLINEIMRTAIPTINMEVPNVFDSNRIQNFAQISQSYF